MADVHIAVGAADFDAGLVAIVSDDDDFIVVDMAGLFAGICTIQAFGTEIQAVASGAVIVHLYAVADDLIHAAVIVGIESNERESAAVIVAADDGVAVEFGNAVVVVGIYGTVLGIPEGVAFKIDGGFHHLGSRASHIHEIGVVITAPDVVADEVQFYGVGGGIACTLVPDGGEVSVARSFVGIAMFAMVLVFSLVTLPVEINASRRALAWLESSNSLSAQEIDQAQEALKWAARTYIVAALSALVTLIYYLGFANRD